MNNPSFSDVSKNLEDELLLLRQQAGYRVRDKEDMPELVINLPNGKKKAGKPKGETGTNSGAPDTDFIERQIGSWDLVDVNYFEKGVLSAKPVCKLTAKDHRGRYEGTGFLISNRLLLTNNHNIPTKAIAATVFLEFDFQFGTDDMPKTDHRFKLAPNDAFWTDEDLDVTIVAVKPFSDASNVPIEQFGALPFNPQTGKIDVGQFISLIHHPDGDFKQAAIRENRLLRKDEKVLWYASDTAPGSSGAPCFSDQWEVLAIHRRGVPQTKEGDDNLIALKNGNFLTREEISEYRISDSEILWLANEGTRVSVLVNTVQNDEVANSNPLISNWLSGLGYPEQERLAATLIAPTPNRPLNPIISDKANTPTLENRRPKSDYDKRNGYQPFFLDIEIPAPKLNEAIRRWGPATPNIQTGQAELPYYNFSIWMSYNRRLPFVAAVNVDGQNHNAQNRRAFGNDKWVYDERIPENLQIGNWFYSNEPVEHGKNYFDRGHIVRRTEPTWGSDHIAQLANDDTFHWTNCSPQYKTFNQQSKYWQGLEDYLLEDGAVAHHKKLTLFSGPIFSNEDTEHRGVLIPKQFFKVAVYVDQQGILRSAAFVLDQSKWVDFIDFERAPALDIKAVRRSIGWLESQTGINFGEKVRFADQASNLQDNLTEIVNLPDLFTY